MHSGHDFGDELPAITCPDRAAWRAWLDRHHAGASGCRRQYVLWLSTAKRPETRRKRLDEAIRLLAEGRRLGMK